MEIILSFIILAILSRAIVPVLFASLTTKNRMLIISLTMVVALIVSLLVNWYYNINLIKEFNSINNKDRIIILIIGALCTYGAIYFVTGTLTESKYPVRDYAIINALTPVVSFLIAYFFLKEKMTRKIGAALVLITISIYLLIKK